MTMFDYEGKSYSLEITRAGVREAEKQGLNITEIDDKPWSMLGLLFYAALYKQRVPLGRALGMLDDLLDTKVLNVKELMSELSDAYSELFGLDEPED